MRRWRWNSRTAGAMLCALGAWAGVLPASLAAQQDRVADGPRATYWVYVANESSDLVSRVRFGPGGLVEEKVVPVGIMPADLEGAHGITVAPDGRHWFVSLAHGTPFGRVWRFRTGTDQLVDSATAGLFPATMGITPDGSTLFAANFNLHGNHVPSSVSAFFTAGMQAMTKITTCVMPHGSRVNRAGTRHYSVCMMDDQLVEISTARLEVTRRLDLAAGDITIADPTAMVESRAERMVHAPQCKPTWVAIAPDDRFLYVPCNGAGEVLEVEAETLGITRRFGTGRGPYNAAVTPDGTRLLVTLKGEQRVAIIALDSGRETRVETSRPVTHGVTITPDSRYAFVSNEGVGATPGTVDVIDLARNARVASVAVRYQPGGIDFWKMERR